MNYTLVILGVILLVIIYILYKVISEQGKVISKKVDLSNSNGTISYSTLSNPKSSRYSMSIWVYIDTLNPTTQTEIFKVQNSGNTVMRLYVDPDTTLKYEIDTTANGIVTHEVMTNFPLQKWAYVIISVDNKIVDLYVDGKLIRSTQLDTMPTVTSKDSNVSYGLCTSGCKGYISKFERIPRPMDPSTAWNKYMDGNGGNYFSKLLSSYGGRVTITKDDLDLRQFTLF
jgi:hypothetical protein